VRFGATMMIIDDHNCEHHTGRYEYHNEAEVGGCKIIFIVSFHLILKKNKQINGTASLVCGIASATINMNTHSDMNIVTPEFICNFKFDYMN
jgi:hypothetical protein